jgi:alanine racemase
MVKANAYGLGVDGVVAALEPAAPLAYGVASVNEGRHLRDLGVTRPVLLLAPTPPGSHGAAVEAGLTVSVSDLASLHLLDAAARRAGAVARFHVEVDTGLGRAGFTWSAVDAWGPEVAARHGERLRWVGCYTQLHSPDEPDPASVREQWARFQEALDAMDLPREDFVVHVANSAGALRLGAELPPVARPGIFLYGGRAGQDLPRPEAVVSVRSRIAFLRDAPPGSTLGYGATHTARSHERWAALAIGYGDGLPRALGNRGEALVAGRRVPIIGRVSMDVTVVNISDLDGVVLGDVGTLVGRDGEEEITVDEVAEHAGTIAYEIFTGLTSRLPRIWVEDGPS